jgi:hypothetical protein
VDAQLSGNVEKELLFYRTLLSGALDPDKLDYLNRDARYCGVPYGAQDVDFILSRLYPFPEQGAAIDARGIPSVESILFSKYLMYRAVYWHPQVRSATGMIKKALLGGLESGLIAREELYDLDDGGLFALLRSRSHPLFALGDMVRDGRFFAAVAEFPYNEEDHRNLRDIGNRSRHEQALAAEFSEALGRPILPGELIIDVPEPISFEAGLYVTDERCFFSESSSVFKAGTVEGFVKSLQIIRIFVDSKHENRLKSFLGLNDILHIRQKWLQLY